MRETDDDDDRSSFEILASAEPAAAVDEMPSYEILGADEPQDVIDEDEDEDDIDLDDIDLDALDREDSVAGEDEDEDVDSILEGEGDEDEGEGEDESEEDLSGTTGADEVLPSDAAFDVAVLTPEGEDAADETNDDIDDSELIGFEDLPNDAAFDLAVFHHLSAPVKDAVGTEGATTGADEVLPSDAAFDVAMMTPVVGEDLPSNAPAFQDAIDVRAAADVPILNMEPPKGELRDWEINFGPTWAPAGEVVVISVPQQSLFKGLKVMATDTANDPGSGTRITKVLVGNRVQRPTGGDAGTYTKFFAANALANGLEWDTCAPGLSISVEVSFIQACTFDMVVFGKCAL